MHPSLFHDLMFCSLVDICTSQEVRNCTGKSSTGEGPFAKSQFVTLTPPPSKYNDLSFGKVKFDTFISTALTTCAAQNKVFCLCSGTDRAGWEKYGVEGKKHK